MEVTFFLLRYPFQLTGFPYHINVCGDFFFFLNTKRKENKNQLDWACLINLNLSLWRNILHFSQLHHSSKVCKKIKNKCSPRHLKQNHNRMLALCSRVDWERVHEPDLCLHLWSTSRRHNTASWWLSRWMLWLRLCELRAAGAM